MNRLFPLVLLALATAMLAQDQAPTPSTPSSGVVTAAKPAANQGAAGEKTVPEATTDPNDPLFGVPPMPKGQVSMIGGTVDKIDRIHNRVNVKVFSGSRMSLHFDERTHIYRDGVETTERGIQKGDRVYVDTQLDGPKLFARNIRVVTNTTPADARGQIVAYDRRSGLMTLRDDLSSRAVTFAVDKNTQISGNNGVSMNQLQPGSLVAVQFATDGKRSVARQVSLLATPGEHYLFQGKVSFLDLRSGLLAISNRSDQKTYDIHFDPKASSIGDITVGSEVTIDATFQASGYRADNIRPAVAQTSEKQ